MAKVMDRVALVRSGSHNNHHHETATNWVLSGRFGTPFGDYPAVGAVVAHETGFSGSVAPYVAVPRNPSFTWELGKSAFLGDRSESFKAGDPSRANGDELQVREMVHSSESRRAFAIDQESDRLRNRYGRNTAGQSMLLARRLVEGGVRFVTVNYAGWDHHAKIFDSLDRRLPEFDKAMSALIEDMNARGTFDETLLVVMSEFGRTPKLNMDAGRDHWGHAASLLFAGAGVSAASCSVRPTITRVRDRAPISPADVACTILDALGLIRAATQAPDGRPIAILDAGERPGIVCVETSIVASRSVSEWSNVALVSHASGSPCNISTCLVCRNSGSRYYRVISHSRRLCRACRDFRSADWLAGRRARARQFLRWLLHGRQDRSGPKSLRPHESATRSRDLKVVAEADGKEVVAGSAPYEVDIGQHLEGDHIPRREARGRL